MGGALSKHVCLVRRAQSLPVSASGHQLTEALQPTMTVTTLTDDHENHRMQPSVTMTVVSYRRGKVMITGATHNGRSALWFHLDESSSGSGVHQQVNSSCKIMAAVGGVSENGGSAMRCAVHQKTTTSGACTEVDGHFCEIYPTNWKASSSCFTSPGRGVVRATASSREGSSGAVETIATYEDSRTGVRKRSVARHIGDRSHVSKRSRNELKGEEKEQEELVNIPYEELGDFDKESNKRMGQS